MPKRAKSKKKVLFLVAALIIGVVGGFLLSYYSGWIFREDFLMRKLDKLGKEYYADYVDELGRTMSAEGVEATLNQISNFGMDVNLDNLLKGNNAKFENQMHHFSDCDRKNTTVQLIPKSPFDKKSVEIVVKLRCSGV
ncbi:MAG: hypothetical protein LBQ02_00815 [Candidatus Nomurabacteria bacterium]|jgi:hypothetical protein|nr:hypothetical protein [Candidatus Nomurabacteria bacterium]